MTLEALGEYITLSILIFLITQVKTGLNLQKENGTHAQKLHFAIKLKVFSLIAIVHDLSSQLLVIRSV